MSEIEHSSSDGRAQRLSDMDRALNPQGDRRISHSGEPPVVTRNTPPVLADDKPEQSSPSTMQALVARVRNLFSRGGSTVVDDAAERRSNNSWSEQDYLTNLTRWDLEPEHESESIREAWGPKDEDVEEEPWTGNWLESEDAPLVPNATPPAGSNASSSTGSYQTVLDPDLWVALDLQPLYEGIANALPADYALKPPVRPNCWLPDDGAYRPESTAPAYLGGLQGAVQQCKFLPRARMGGNDTIVEQFEFVSRQLGQLLATKPPTNAAASLVGSLAALNARLAQARMRLGDDAMTGAALTACEEKARALVIDVATSAGLTGKALVAFLEGTHGKDMQALLQCTIELPPARQTEVFDGSRSLRTALRIRSGVRGRVANAANDVLHPRQGGLSVRLDKAAEGWAYAAIHAQRNSVKSNALANIEQLDEPPRTKLQKLKHTLAKPQSLGPIRETIVPILGEGATFMGEHGQRAGQVVRHHSWFLNEADWSRTLASMLVLRSALTKEGKDQPQLGKPPPYQWLDQVLDSKARDIVKAIKHIGDDMVAEAVARWVATLAEGKSSPAPRLRALGTEIHREATTMPDGPRKDMLLLALLDAKETLPTDHTARLLIDSTLRNAGADWAQRIGQPGLIDQVREEELRLYPKAIAQGHSFIKHVQGKNNPEGKEFDDLLGTRGGKQARRAQYEDHIRKVIEQPDEHDIDATLAQHFYHKETQTAIVLDPRRKDGGTAYTQSHGRYLDRAENRHWSTVPLDSYSNLSASSAVAQTAIGTGGIDSSAVSDEQGVTTEAGRTRPTQITLADGTQVPGFMVKSSAGGSVEHAAFCAPDDPMGYHEAQQGAQCGRHTLNMIDPGDNLATQEDYHAFLAEKYAAQSPRIALPNGTHRDATKEEIDDLIRKDTGESLLTIAEFQAWRRQQPGGQGLKHVIAGNGSTDSDGALSDAKRDLAGAEAFGVGYQKKGKSAQHNVAIKRMDGAFRVYDSQKSTREVLDGNTAIEALKDFMHKHAQSVPGFGSAFEYVVPAATQQP